MNIPIYKYQNQCYKCFKEIELFYPERFAYHNNIGNVNETYSNTMGRKTLGNICPYCGKYQGNNYVQNYFHNNTYKDDFMDHIIWVNGKLRCEECNELYEYPFFDVISDVDNYNIEDFYCCIPGRLCPSCESNQKIDYLIKELSNTHICVLCNKVIFESYDEYSNYMITLDESTLTQSPGEDHHINYQKNITIPM
ncbi:unnamed protein product, partial [marine sediment metagenome]